MNAIVVSVNVGLPRDVTWSGQTVRTAIWKEPVNGRVLATRLNLTGDGQADLSGHGGEQRAVMVYQLASYRHWENYLRRSDLVYGNFGENFTIDGLADDEVCIGDRFRIGDAIFEISQPRVTCYKVGLRLDHPEMPALLVSHHRPGFYFRVIQEGQVGAGDSVEKIADGPEQMTVAEIDALLYSAHHPVEALRRALRIPALSPGWQTSMRALLDAAEKGNSQGNAGLSRTASVAVSWRGFRPLKVVASREESVDVRSFELAAIDGSHLPAARPGQHVVLKLPATADSPSVVRNYSLCGQTSAATYAIAVKNEGGPGSGFLHRHVHVGDILETSAPRGSFTLAPGAAPVVLISGGIGLTPLLSMLYALASDEHTPREVWWIHAARDGAHHSFAAQVKTLMKSLQRGYRHTIYSRPGTSDRLGIDYDVQDHISVTLLERLNVPKLANFYLCGPAGFLASLTEALKKWPVDASRIHVEVFGAGVGDKGKPPHLPSGPEGTGPKVAFLKSNISLRWDAARYRSLLELAEACSVPVRWSCRSGVCHSCAAGLIDGQLGYAPDPLDPPPESTALICCATPVTDIALDL